MKLRICYLYPDILNLYGDRGNVLCLMRRLAWRGIEPELTMLPMGEHPRLGAFDLFFIGGGQDFNQEMLLKDLDAKGKADEIRNAIELDKVFLAICGGYQMLGKSYVTSRGKKCNFIGALDIRTVSSEKRMIGDYAFKCTPESGGHTIVGFENHSGKTYLGEGVAPLGTVICGNGNNGEDKTEGARYRNVFGSYAHGPILPKNPEFADYILELALRIKNPGYVLPPLDDYLENKAHNFISKRLAVPFTPIIEPEPETSPPQPVEEDEDKYGSEEFEFNPADYGLDEEDLKAFEDLDDEEYDEDIDVDHEDDEEDS